MFGVGSVVVLINEYTHDLDLVTGSGRVYEVVQDVDFFLSWDSTGRNRSRGLLHGPLLVVSINALRFFYFVFALVLAADAGA